MLKKLKLEIITQERQVFKDEVDMVLAPSFKGQIGILPGHIGLLTKLDTGEVYIIKGANLTILGVTGGLLNVHHDQISIMADQAVRADEVNIQKAEKAIAQAKEALKQKLSDRDYAVAEADLRKAVLELRVANKKHSRYQPTSFV